VNGAGVKEFRRQRQWRQRDLATHLGVDQPTVSEWERDIRPVPDEIAVRLESEELLPAADAASSHGGEPAEKPPAGDASQATAAVGGDVPPRDVRPPKERPAVLPAEDERGLAALEVRVLKLIQGEDISIPVADVGETTVRYAEQHIPGVADVVGMVNEFDGEIIRANSVAMAKAWVKLARENVRVRRFLEMLTAGGAWRDVFAATAPVVIAILLNHGLLPSLPGLTLGTTPEYDAAHDDGTGTPIRDRPGWEETAAGSVG
jgi:DNA-binding XRE family transcriptional regulator